MKKLVFGLIIGSTLILGSAFDQPLKVNEPLEQVYELDKQEKSETKSYVQQEFEALTSDFQNEDGKSISEMIGEVIIDSVQIAVKAVVSFFGRIFS
ncbi:hypothetical protein [Jiulongibacter sediminis]|uniref:Uncharacterized protein n=1 Tax=Jiulongibacter sediminis TaxID=1605367 RepID=A0A0P7C7L1_9BACT|nr:hypothetical protein [Jiulongibacter sediminis]KPM49552.1 hypothetical protein AFM12_02830 [Jiulongibacter sediminis]TBX26593.1 hypothetical protein TK44_02835 [Jiulongibacter sediminis]